MEQETPTYDTALGVMAEILGHEDFWDDTRIEIGDYGVGIVGYDDEAVWVTANWNPARFPRHGEPELTADEALPVRMAEALEAAGVETLWSDEWTRCDTCYKAVRTEPDSYSWQPQYLYLEDWGIVCSPCIKADPDGVLAEFVNDPFKALPTEFTFLLGDEWTPAGDREVNGWYDGADADPRAIFDRLAVDHDEVVFALTDIGQFHVGFRAYVKHE